MGIATDTKAYFNSFKNPAGMKQESVWHQGWTFEAHHAVPRCTKFYFPHRLMIISGNPCCTWVIFSERY